MAIDRIENQALVEAGLSAMRQCGKPLTRLPSKGRAKLYAMADGQTVRVRTCNDHILIIVGDSAAPDAKLNIEGTDYLLVVMPEVERTKGKTLSYLLPTSVVEAEARRTHEEWLAGNPTTKGDNKTWNLWFGKDAPTKANDYATKWSKYKLETVVETPSLISTHAKSTGNVKDEVETARRRIAAAAGVPIEAVKIVINFEG